MDETTILSARDLNLWYGENHALKGVNMDIPERQVTALIGPSGCGKSTFLKTLDRMNDLVPGIKITGSVKYRDQEIYDPSVDVTWLRKQIGMVFQKPNPFPMSIYDNIAYGPRTHGIRSKSRLDDIVEKSLRGAAIWDEVKDRLKKSALSLSGGQQQRICIARALAVEPDILLMDEAGPDRGPEEGLHHCHRHPQHAAGHPRLGQVRLLPDGRAHRVRRHHPALLHAQRQADRGLHHREVRIK